MRDLLLFVALPYTSLVLLVVGSVWRFRADPFSYSALSSQVLESRRLVWGSVPWHLAILVIFFGHLLPIVFPGLWLALVAHRPVLLTVETIGVAAAVLALAGLLVLVARRLLSPRLQRVTSVMDLTVAGLLFAQVAVGLGVALTHRWGSRWAAGTLAPYLLGLLTFRPDLTWVTGMPPLVKLHLFGAWIIFALVPFTRLVHAFSVPLSYLTRAPQKVVWATRRPLDPRTQAALAAAESRRLFIKGAAGTTAAVGLLGVGVLNNLVRFFRGPRMTRQTQADLLQQRLERMRMSAEERQLELDRMSLDYIEVSPLAQLEPAQGKYFTDYNMRPALAFRDQTSGLPLLLSAKCTHLGCTVANQMNSDGLILCPCHLSYFQVETGRPTPGSPTQVPLPMLGWVLRDAAGRELARKRPRGPVEGAWTPDTLKTATVFIAREYAAEEL
jgi:nitrate reductase gamma subunit